LLSIAGEEVPDAASAGGGLLGAGVLFWAKAGAMLSPARIAVTASVFMTPPRVNGIGRTGERDRGFSQ
jgi:hypothetical protein